MKACPNPECPYAVRRGIAAEYRDDASVCSDCGTALVGGSPAPREKKAALVTPGASTVERLLVTLGGGAAILGLEHAPLLGAASSVVNGASSRVLPVGLLWVGITPFVSGFILVEMIALILPPLRARRVGSPTERRPLQRAAWICGFALLVVQIATIQQSRGNRMLELPSPGLLWVELLGAELVLLGILALVTRRGLCHGFALALGLEALEGLLGAGDSISKQFRQEAISASALGMTLVIFGGTAAFVWLIAEEPALADGSPSGVPFPVSGTGVWDVAVALLSLPATLGYWIPAVSILGNLFAAGLARVGALAFVSVDAALLLGFLYFRPRSVGQLWARWVPGTDPVGVESRARSLLPRALGLSVAVNVVAPMALTVLMTTQDSSGIRAGTIQFLVMLLFWVRDLLAEWRARHRLGPLEAVRQVQRTAEIEPIVRALGAAGIEAHARTFGLRTTQQFFAPFLPMEILVPVAHAADARAVLDGR